MTWSHLRQMLVLRWILRPWLIGFLFGLISIAGYFVLLSLYSPLHGETINAAFTVLAPLSLIGEFFAAPIDTAVEALVRFARFETAGEETWYGIAAVPVYWSVIAELMTAVRFNSESLRNIARIAIAVVAVLLPFVVHAVILMIS